MKNAYFAATIALLSGCSLINSLDSVKPEASETDGGTGGHAGKGGKGSGGHAGSGGNAGDSAGGTAGAADTGGTTGAGGTTGTDAGIAGMDAGAGGSGIVDSGAGGGGGGAEAGTGGTDGGTFTPGGPNGAIVAYDPDAQKTLVLDPTDAHQVSSFESIRILAFANDPATDYWYVFRQPGKPTDPAELQVRQLNTTTGEWQDVGAPTTVPAPMTPTVGVLNQRLAYLSVDPLNPTTGAFTVLDTSNVPTIAVPGRNRVLPAGGKVALTARANPTAVGGTVTIALQGTCDASGCPVSVVGETINGTTIKEDAAPTMIGTVSATGGSMGFASMEGTTSADVVVMPPTALTGATPTMCTPGSGSTGSAVVLDNFHAKVGIGYDFDIDNLRVSAAAFDPCHNVAFATSLLGDTAIWAIPLVSPGTPQKLCTQGGGGALLFELYTHGVLRITPDNNRFELYDVDETDPTAPKMTARTLKFPAVFSNKGAVIAVRRRKQACM